MQLPISVVIPHLRSRAEFFNRYVLPSIVANRPAKIIIEPNDGGDPRLAAIHRNLGAQRAVQRFVCFMDDDTIYGADYLVTLLSALDSSAAAYAYGDYYDVAGAGLRTSRPFDLEALRERNYIHTSALIRRDAWIPFDEQLGRFQDWDLWLSMAARGHGGLYVPGARLLGFMIDEGISRSHDGEDWCAKIRRKHAL